jgi:ketosteroid isomerase-like protein
MSANLDLVRSIFAAWERGDFSSASWAHPDIVYESNGFDAAKATGVAEMAQRWRRLAMVTRVSPGYLTVKPITTGFSATLAIDGLPTSW